MTTTTTAVPSRGLPDRGWADRSLPLAAATPPPSTYFLTGARMLIYLVSPDRATYWRVGQWTSLTVEKEGHDAGLLSITAPTNAGWIRSATSESDFDTVTGWERFSFNVYIDNTLEWSGPIVNRVHAPGLAPHSYPSATFTAETFTQHLAKRRANNTTSKVDVLYTDNADDIIRQALRDCSGTITPTGYPVGVSRTDFGDWTVAVEANTGTASSISVSEQDGKNVWLFVNHVADKGDCYIYTTESPAATFTYKVTSPYQGRDARAVVLTPAAGSVLSWSETRTILDLVNVAAVKGDGDGATQVKGWQATTSSITTRGVFESEATVPGASSTTYTDTEATAILAKQAEPTDTLEVEIRSTPGARFVYHTASTTGEYGMRDLVTLAFPTISVAAEAIIRGWKIEQSGAGPIKESIIVGDIRPSVVKSAALRSGWPGPFSSGDYYRNNNG